MLGKHILVAILLAGRLANAANEREESPLQDSVSKHEIRRLPSPACIHHPERPFCQLDPQELQRREQHIINYQWNIVKSVLPRLQSATMRRPFSADDSSDDLPYKNYCEALRQDLINGNFKVLRTPDVASSQMGIGGLASGFARVEKECNSKANKFTWARDALEGDWKFDGGRWLYKLTNGFASISFDLPAETYWLDYDFNRCNSANGLPTYARKGTSAADNRTEVVGMTVIERGVRDLVGLEYIELFGDGEDDHQNAVYGGALYAGEVTASGILTHPTRKPKNGRTARRSDPTELPARPTSRFIGAFIVPPPWDDLYPELHSDNSPGLPRHNEPCVWKISD